MKVLCFTGHRPDKLNGYNAADNKKLLWHLQKEIIRYIEEEEVGIFINGLALGIDQWAAKIVIKLKEKYDHVKLISAVPCLNHNNKWPDESKEVWQYIVNNSDWVYNVTEKEYTPSCMQLRNQFMVDCSDIVLGVWNGTEGGTKNCLDYAEKKEKRVDIIDPDKFK